MPMTPERWRQVEALYHGAVEQPPARRPAWLGEACAGDAELRRDVESLLAQRSPAVGTLDGTALVAAAELAGDRSVTLAPGRRLGTYEILARIGAGGMGEVYRARDTRLGREVAIKTLPREFKGDPDRSARFEREARVLASLNHPNIATIHGVEEGDGVTGLVLELVPGETLADRVARTKQGGLPVAEALRIAQQIADALDAAHEKGIVHRDLKPANVKITSDGLIKVLDFGLAKLQHGDIGPNVSHAPTVTFGGTREGVIVGTAAYMSPEQARGQAVDKRTDIWAFGCVLYEMLTGRAAFARGTMTDTLAAIVEHSPAWDALPASTPRGVVRLIRRCLDKDPRLRLRDIGDAAAELDDARSAPETRPSTPLEPRLAVRSVVPWLVAATTLIVAVTATSLTFWRAPITGAPRGAPPRFSRIIRVTNGPARELGPAISPDGKWVAYLSNLSGRPDVWVKFLAGGEAANLTASAGLDISTTTGITGLEISPDGTRIAVMANPRGSSGTFATWEIPAPLPGAPRKLLDNGFLGMRWSPDGRAMTFIRAGGAAGDALWVADADGANRRELIPARNGIHIHWPTMSSDGFVYFIRTISTIANLDQAEIYRIAAGGGTEEPVVSTLRRAMHPLLMPDRQSLVYAANPSGVDLGLWWRPISGGDAQRLTMGTGDYSEPRVSADGRTIIATRYELRQSLKRVMVRAAEFGQMMDITDGYDGDLDPSLSPVGNLLAFSSSRTGDRHIWIAREDGSDARPLTSGDALDDRPSFSPDGSQVAFNSDRDGRRAIWIISAEGGTPRRVVDAAVTGGLSWSRDGQRIVYAAGANSWPSLWSVNVDTGQVERIAAPGAVSEPAWSPTRDVLAYLEPTTSGPSSTRLTFVTPAGARVYETLPLVPAISSGFSNGVLAWSPDGRLLAVGSQNTNLPASLWLVDPEASIPFRKLVELPPGPRIRGVTWTRDGSALIIGQHDASSDIVLLDGR